MRLIIFISMFIAVFNLNAQKIVTEEKPKPFIESWYFNLSIGYASTQYDDENQAFIDLIKKADGVSNISVFFDLGFYWPINKRTILGLSYNGIGDRFTVRNEWVQLNQYLIGPSLMYYVNEFIGKGLFIRGDVGFGNAIVQNSENETYSSDYGLAYLVGAGWGIPISEETRILLHINYTNRSIVKESFGGVTFNVGFLW